MFKRVDFPHPEGPRIASNCPITLNQAQARKAPDSTKPLTFCKISLGPVLVGTEYEIFFHPNVICASWSEGFSSTSRLAVVDAIGRYDGRRGLLNHVGDMDNYNVREARTTAAAKFGRDILFKHALPSTRGQE